MLMIQPPPRLRRCGNRGVAEVEDAAEIGVDHLLPLLDGHVGDVANTPTPALLIRMSSPPNAGRV